MTNSPDLGKILNFIQLGENLKMLLSHSWLSSGRQKSRADFVHGIQEVKFDKVLQDFKNLIDSQTKSKIVKSK